MLIVCAILMHYNDEKHIQNILPLFILFFYLTSHMWRSIWDYPLSLIYSRCKYLCSLFCLGGWDNLANWKICVSTGCTIICSKQQSNFSIWLFMSNMQICLQQQVEKRWVIWTHQRNNYLRSILHCFQWLVLFHIFSRYFNTPLKYHVSLIISKSHLAELFIWL